MAALALIGIRSHLDETAGHAVGSVLLAMDVVNQKTGGIANHFWCLKVWCLKGPPGILVPALPVLTHGCAGELVLGVAFVGLLLLDYMRRIVISGKSASSSFVAR